MNRDEEITKLFSLEAELDSMVLSCSNKKVLATALLGVKNATVAFYLSPGDCLAPLKTGRAYGYLFKARELQSELDEG